LASRAHLVIWKLISPTNVQAKQFQQVKAADAWQGLDGEHLCTAPKELITMAALEMTLASFLHKEFCFSLGNVPD
jgi:hypothetical protein